MPVLRKLHRIESNESKFNEITKQQKQLLFVEDKRQSAQNFLVSQRHRASRIEQDLLAATVNILPPSKESKTITELSELCRLTQESTRDKLRIFKSYLEDAGYIVESPRTKQILERKSSIKRITSSPCVSRKCSKTKAGTENSLSPSPTFFDDSSSPIINLDNMSHNQSYLVSFGEPLECVLEGDYETDGMTTPGSHLQSPPSLSSKKLSASSRKGDRKYDRSHTVSHNSSGAKRGSGKRRITSSSDKITTPTLDRLSISASTNSFLRHMGDEEGNIYNNDGSLMMPSPATGSSFIRRPSSRVSISRELLKPSSSPEYNQQQHLFEFRDEDDMITVDTHSTIAKNNDIRSPKIIASTKYDKNRLSIEERSHFLARMEGMLERVEETILEESPSTKGFEEIDNLSRPSDELETPHVLSRVDKQQQQQHTETSFDIRSKTSLYGEDNFVRDFDDESFDMEESDDSTNMVATLVAESSSSKKQGLRIASADANIVNGTHPFNVYHQRPTHVVVDTGAASPANTHVTNITMDATMMNETYDMSFTRKEEKQSRNIEFAANAIEKKYNYANDIDNLSIETPVLDRFRLVASDTNENCIRVVPNKRRDHRSSQKRTASPGYEGGLPTVAELSPSLAYYHRQSRTPKKELNMSAFSSPLITSSKSLLRGTITPSTKIKKIYRKTPFPKKKVAVSIAEVVDCQRENDHPNVSTRYSIPDSPEPFKHKNPSFNISVPPLRPHSFEPVHVDELKASSHTESSNGIIFKEKTTTIDNKINEALEKIELKLSSPISGKLSNQSY